jgi:hypothetical protein
MSRNQEQSDKNLDKKDTLSALTTIGVEDWQAIEETIFLNRIPGFVESVHQAYQEILEDGGVPLEELDW